MRLKGKIALVTGASRGVGKGIAHALGAEGAKVYLSGRTLEPRKDRPGSLMETVESIVGAGGEAIAIRCDHADDGDVKTLFAQIAEESERLDILVNNVFAIPDGDGLFDTPFWQQPIRFWDVMHTVGLRSHYVASVMGAPLLLRSEHGLIANISSFGGASFQVNVAYGVGKAGVDRLARDMAHDLRPHGVCAVALYPGIVRTERVLSGQLPFDISVSESPELTGRAIAALSLDPERMRHTGKVRVVAELAEEYGFVDVDGTKPVSLRRLASSKKSSDT